MVIYLENNGVIHYVHLWNGEIMSEITLKKRRGLIFANRFQMGDLSQSSRRYTTILLVVILVACLIILLAGLGKYPGQTSLLIPDNLHPDSGLLQIPFSLVLFIIIGFGLVTGAMIFGSFQTGWIRPSVTRFTLGFLSAAVPLYFLRFTELGDLLKDKFSTLQFLLLCLAFLSGFIATLSSWISSPRLARLAPWLGIGAYLGTAVSFLIWKIQLDREMLSPLTSRGPDLLSPVIYLNLLATPLIWFSGIFLFWQVIIEAKIFSREIGLRVANLSARLPWLLATLFTLKLVWLAVGYWSAYQGEAHQVWERSLSDSWQAWILAGIYAIVAGWLLFYTSRPLGSAQLNKSAVFFTAGFLFIFILTYLIYFLGQLFLNIEALPEQISQPISLCFKAGPGSLAAFIYCLANGLSDYFLHWMGLFVAALIPLGFIFLRSKKLRGLAPICFLAGVWALPDVVGVIAFMQGREEINPAFEYLSFDVFLTVVLLFYALLAWRWKSPTARLWTITLVLVVSTLTALAETLIPPTLAETSFVLLLIIPVLYQLLFDSESLNVAGPTRVTRVLWTFSWQAALMVVLAWAVALGRFTSSTSQLDMIATKIFMPVFLGLYLINLRFDHENSHLKTELTQPGCSQRLCFSRRVALGRGIQRTRKRTHAPRW